MARAGNGDGSIRKRETKTKGNVWDVQLTIKDRRGVAHRHTKRGFATRQAAVAWRNAEQRKVRANNALGIKPLTVPEILEKYIAEGGLAKSSAQSYGRHMRLYVKPLLNIRADTVTAPQLQRMADLMHADLSERGHNGASSVALTVGAVRAAMKWAAREDVGLLSYDPLGSAAITTPQRASDGGRPLTMTEYRNLLDASRAASRTAWALIFESAVRDGEALALRWKDLDLDTGRINITRIRTPESNYTEESSRTKGRRNRTTYLSGGLCADLRTLRDARGAKLSDHIIAPQRGTGSLSMGQLQKWWKRDAAKAGIKGRTIHSLRHTWATEALRAGVDIKVVQEVLGHVSLDTTMRYAHATEDGKRNASNVVRSLVSPPVDAAKIAAVHSGQSKIA